MFSADFFPAIAANPFIAFSTVATESGTISFRWTDDNGRGQIETATITVDMRRRAPRLGFALPPSLADDGARRYLAHERRSGFDFMSHETQAMQRDDTANPGMLWVRRRRDPLEEKAGPAGRSCADCHGDARRQHARASPPAIRPSLPEQSRPVDLEGRIKLCRDNPGRTARPLPRESREMLALTAYVAHQSRGMPISTGEDARLAPVLARGRGALSSDGRASCNSPAPIVTTTTGAGDLGGQPIPQATPDRLPLVPPRMAESRLAAAAAAQLHDGRARRALPPRRARSRGA